MNVERGFSLLVEPGQWDDCEFTNTVPLAGGGVQLAWGDTAQDDCAPPPKAVPGGLAFDRLCRAFRSRPDRHHVEVLTEETDTWSPIGPFTRPLGVAVDRSQRLYIADPGERSVWVIDLTNQRVLRRVPICGVPVDVAPHCDGVVVLARAASHLYTAIGRRGPMKGPGLIRPCYPPGLEPIKVAAGPVVLWRNRDGDCAIARPDGSVLGEIRDATDLDISTDGVVTVAREPGRPFARFALGGSHWTETEPLLAPGYDGGALSLDPCGHVAFTTEAGIGWTVGSAARHVGNGTLVTYRMDSRAYRTRWGRAFLDACIPRGTSVLARFATTDDDQQVRPDFGRDGTPLYRRPTGRERPWEQIEGDDRLDTYESAVHAARGRYLWIELTLTGTARLTPRIRAIRVERPGHALLDTLPTSWSRSEIDAEFMQRFLAPADALLYEMDRKAALRAVLVDPSATPQEAFTWLASFAGLTLDERWPESARRTLVAEVYQLFRRRGTKAGLRRMIAIYLGFDPQIIERWQLRGLGGTVLGTTPDGLKTPNIGASMRETGTLGRFMIGGTPLQPTSFATSAHQYAVLINGTLTAEQREVVKVLIETQGPAHAAGTVMELGAGMRIGTLRVNLTSYVGRHPETKKSLLGNAQLGGGGFVGTPVVGSHLGRDSIAGAVRVG